MEVHHFCHLYVLGVCVLAVFLFNRCVERWLLFCVLRNVWQMLLGMTFVTQKLDDLLNPSDTASEVFSMTTGAGTSSDKVLAWRAGFSRSSPQWCVYVMGEALCRSEGDLSSCCERTNAGRNFDLSCKSSWDQRNGDAFVEINFDAEDELCWSFRGHRIC